MAYAMVLSYLHISLQHFGLFHRYVYNVLCASLALIYVRKNVDDDACIIYVHYEVRYIILLHIETVLWCE